MIKPQPPMPIEEILALPFDDPLPEVKPIIIPRDYISPTYNHIPLSIDCLTEYDMDYRPPKGVKRHHWQQSAETFEKNKENRLERGLED